MSNVIDVKGLKVIFEVGPTYIKAVEGIDIHVDEGEAVAIVGESGCGKSVTSLSIMKLLACPPGHFTADKMEFTDKEGNIHNIIDAPESEMNTLREREMAMIFQDPSTFLNPVMTVGEQVDEVFLQHFKTYPDENGTPVKMTKKLAHKLTVEQFKKVGIPDPEMRYKQFPHELSGGLKQRILIAIATACSPRLLIADEPTTALDVTIQAQILELIKNLREKTGSSLLMITHDLGVVRESAQRVYVMYCGKIVEEGTTEEILDDPLHPYTKALIDTVPSFEKKVTRFVQIPHNVPHPSKKPSGCYFSNRCQYCTELCKAKMPPLFDKGNGRKYRCWYKTEELWKK